MTSAGGRYVETLTARWERTTTTWRRTVTFGQPSPTNIRVARQQEEWWRSVRRHGQRGKWYDMDAEEWLPDFEMTVTATVSCNGCEVDADCGDEALAESRAVWCREDNCCGSIFDNLDPSSNLGPF